jgi:septum formation protein
LIVAPLILASASPRRAQLLWAAGIPHEAHPADIDETIRDGESPDAYVRRVSETKARVGASQHPGRPVLGADTVVLVDGQILGKPKDADDARRMLKLLSGRWHDVMTGVCLIGPPAAADAASAPREGGRHHAGGPDDTDPHGAGGRQDTRVVVTAVEFAPLLPEEIEWYVASGEPLDKAAYGIQSLGSRFVTRVEGSYSNVVGLPIAEVYQMCTAAGILLS